MAKRLHGQYSFRLFGNITKIVALEEIVDKVTDIQKEDVKYDTSVSLKEGFWGQVCTALEIPNNKNTRYRIKLAFKKTLTTTSPKTTKMPKTQPGQYSFRLFGNITKIVALQEIVEKIKDIQKEDVKYDTSVSLKEGFWGQVCTALEIPNNKNTRYRIKLAFKKFILAK